MQFFGLYEFRLPQWDGLSAGEKALAAVFQSATPRTAGFNTVDLTALSEPSLLVTILLMLTGGSPGSTAGGFKTTTLAVLILSAFAVFRRRSTAHCFGRRLTESVLRSASAIFLLYLLLFLTGGVLICCMEGIPLITALFEAASAIGYGGAVAGGYAGIGCAIPVDFGISHVFWPCGRPDNDLCCDQRSGHIFPVSAEQVNVG